MVPFAPPVKLPILPEERYYLPPRIARADAEKLAHAAITSGTWRPPDAAKVARIEPALALFVPFWRMDIQRTDESLRVNTVRVGTVGIPIPRPVMRRARATWMICARTSIPYEMKDERTLIQGEVKPLAVNPAALVAGEPATCMRSDEWEVVDADVSEKDARNAGAEALENRNAPNASQGSVTEIACKTDVVVHAVHFVRHPIWFVRYRYEGVASSGKDDLFFVGLSGDTGECVLARHPSKLRAGAAKVKGFFSGVGDSIRSATKSSGEADGGSDLRAKFEAFAKKKRGE